jgi:hypothetical protein
LINLHAADQLVSRKVPFRSSTSKTMTAMPLKTEFYDEKGGREEEERRKEKEEKRYKTLT